MKDRKLDLRRVTKKNLENNITGRTEYGAYFADINGVEVMFECRKRFDEIYCPVCDKDDPDCNRIYVYRDDYDGMNIGRQYDTLVKIIKF